MQLNQKNKKSLLLGAGALIVVAAIGAGLWMGAHPTPEPFYGMIQAKTVDISAKVTGRVKALPVVEGQDVKIGETLIELSIPEVEAKLKEVEALRTAADAMSNMVDEGARPQEVRAAEAQMLRAKAGETLARQTYNRVAALYKDGLISRQKYDEALANFRSSKELLQMATQQFEIAKTGARSQEKTAAQAKAQQAMGGVEQVQSLVNEKNVISPIAGEVSRLFVEEGEIAAAGIPMATIVDLTNQWATFNIREDHMKTVVKGAILKAKIPALGDKTYNFKVYFINPRADYATWRATRQSTGFDLRTFEVRARPVEPIMNLRPGMSVIVAR